MGAVNSHRHRRTSSLKRIKESNTKSNGKRMMHVAYSYHLLFLFFFSIHQ